MALPTAAEFLMKESEFVYSLYQAAELEVRATERYVLVALAGLYSYLATRSAIDIPKRFRPVAWYTPVALVIFAGVRALGLGLRQHYVMVWLQNAEDKILPQLPNGVTPKLGWANFLVCKPWVVSSTAAAFYGVLMIATILIALLMSRSGDKTVVGRNLRTKN